jgi:hypothetical protein
MKSDWLKIFSAAVITIVIMCLVVSCAYFILTLKNPCDTDINCDECVHWKNRYPKEFSKYKEQRDKDSVDLHPSRLQEK